MRPIDADVLYDTMLEVGWWNNADRDEIALPIIENAPTITADRPRGEWIEHEWAEEVEGLLIPNYECSECHSWERNASNFCPNCGSKMQGEGRNRQ